MNSSFSTTTAATLGAAEAVGASDAADVGAAEVVAAADGDDEPPDEHAARNAAAADKPPAYMKPRRLSGVCAILRMT